MFEMSNDSIRSGKYDSSSSSCSSSSTFCESGFSTRKRCSKAIFAFVSTSSTRCAFLAAFRVEYPDAAAAAFRQQLFENGAVLKILRHVDLERNVIGRIILRQDLAEKLRRIECIVLGQVFPKKFAAADDPPLRAL